MAGTVHQPFGTAAGHCNTCHSTHRAQSANALIAATSQTALCTTCHGPEGLGGAVDVTSQFGAGTPNDVATRSFWSHDLTAPGHTTAKAELASGMLTRHSQCSDCHNPHNVTATRASYDAATATWTPSGSYGTTGVQPVFGAAGTTPTYTLLDPSANPSYHPVEAAGRNQPPMLAASLSLPSTYRLWTLSTTDTIRCTMCHTSSATPAGTPADAALPTHASANRGILVRPYENRALPPRGQYRQTTDFALCLTCHVETPFLNQRAPGATTATNFGWHGFHTAGLSLRGSGGTDIDVAGAGQNNALCAECHFRSHSTSDAVPGQKLDGAALVSFSPNVEASVRVGGVPTFVRTDRGGSCTLKCHGKEHQGTVYVRPVG